MAFTWTSVSYTHLDVYKRQLYGPTATVLFRNLTGGACVELFLPIERDENTGGIST